MLLPKKHYKRPNELLKLFKILWFGDGRGLIWFQYGYHFGGCFL